jgi:hypothetical protein
MDKPIYTMTTDRKRIECKEALADIERILTFVDLSANERDAYTAAANALEGAIEAHTHRNR